MTQSIVGDGCQQLLNFCFRIGVDSFMRLAHPVDPFGDIASNDALSFGVGYKLRIFFGVNAADGPRAVRALS